jgi:hypothetical protein
MQVHSRTYNNTEVKLCLLLLQLAYVLLCAAHKEIHGTAPACVMLAVLDPNQQLSCAVDGIQRGSLTAIGLTHLAQWGCHLHILCTQVLPGVSG